MPATAQLLWHTLLPSPADGDEWLSVTFVPELEGVCCVSRSGQLVKVHAEYAAVEAVGDISTGISAVAWSPDQEVCVIVTLGNTLVAMTSSWQVCGRCLCRSCRARWCRCGCAC